MWPLVLRGGLLRRIGLPNLLLEINEWLLKKHGFFFERVNYPNVEFGGFVKLFKIAFKDKSIYLFSCPQTAQ